MFAAKLTKAVLLLLPSSQTNLVLTSIFRHICL